MTRKGENYYYNSDLSSPQRSSGDHRWWRHPLVWFNFNTTTILPLLHNMWLDAGKKWIPSLDSQESKLIKKRLWRPLSRSLSPTILLLPLLSLAKEYQLLAKAHSESIGYSIVSSSRRLVGLSPEYTRIFRVNSYTEESERKSNRKTRRFRMLVSVVLPYWRIYYYSRYGGVFDERCS